VTAWDVVHWLEDAEPLFEEVARRLRRKMRQAGWAFLPCGEQNLYVWLERAVVSDGAVQETYPLRVGCPQLQA